jgi:hypothetical protein
VAPKHAERLSEQHGTLEIIRTDVGGLADGTFVNGNANVSCDAFSGQHWIEDWRPRVVQAFRPVVSRRACATPHKRYKRTARDLKGSSQDRSKRRLAMLTLVNLVLIVMALVVVYWGLRVLISRGS